MDIRLGPFFLAGYAIRWWLENYTYKVNVGLLGICAFRTWCAYSGMVYDELSVNQGCVIEPGERIERVVTFPTFDFIFKADILKPRHISLQTFTIQPLIPAHDVILALHARNYAKYLSSNQRELHKSMKKLVTTGIRLNAIQERLRAHLFGRGQAIS